MADGYQVRIIGGEQLERRLRQFELLVSDLRPFWPVVSRLATGWWKLQFATEGAFAGLPWARLDPRYAIFKTLHKPGKGILQYSGAMKQAVSRPRRFATARSLILEIESDYLPYHQDGTTKMPARPVVFPTSSSAVLPLVAQAELDQAAEAYVGDFLRRL
jgi:hypothetical protein